MYQKIQKLYLSYREEKQKAKTASEGSTKKGQTSVKGFMDW